MKTGNLAKKAAAVLVPGVSLMVFALPGTAAAAPAPAEVRAVHGLQGLQALCGIPAKVVDRLPVCHRVNGWQ
ncbi:hypothetical protein FGW37_15600 [Streptomyces rectiverticillatus]|uniref:hypothetical protein n=1 Tax=Streptomyces rectiverticillatus TaxID=173860 RepID=UPI0015C30A83|nr:hypothetical protein [Streptomyces rectiverticillatus]QLE72822.1 hypothetical protein FGW37_15600 [Streptomyces rectiverticillatus]